MVQYSSDLITLLGADLRIVYESPAVGAVLGHPPSEIVGKFLEEFIHPDDALTVQAQFTKVLTGGLRASAKFEYRAAHASGGWRTIDTVINNLLDEPDVGAIVLNGRDVTDRRELEMELNHKAFHDTLTGLANRALFLDRLSHAMDRGDRQADPIAVLFLDLDDFKTVNDSLGHPAGDRLLVAVAERLRRATRPGDTVARFGGDEFAVLVESGSMPAAAEAVAERITEALIPTFQVLTSEVSMRASIGIALGQRPAGDARRPAARRRSRDVPGETQREGSLRDVPTRHALRRRPSPGDGRRHASRARGGPVRGVLSADRQYTHAAD